MGDIERAREPYSPDMSDTAVHISLLETERDGLRLMVADLQRALEDANGHVAALSAALTTRRSACDEESERADWAEQRIRELEGELDAARKPEDYWRQVAEATELSKKGLEQDNAILKQERDDLVRDIEKQNKDIDEHQARWQRAERELAEMRRTLNRIARGAELQAHIMRDPLRTGGWSGAERVADAFDDIAERARAAVQTSEAKSPPG